MVADGGLGAKTRDVEARRTEIEIKECGAGRRRMGGGRGGDRGGAAARGEGKPR
jgi:hypothetical protein